MQGVQLSSLNEAAEVDRATAASRWRRWLALALVIAPVLSVVAVDFTRRGERLLGLEGKYVWTYLGAVCESAVLWGVLLYAAAARTGPLRWVARVLFVLFFSLTFGGQSYFFEQYNAYLNVDVSVFASNFADSVVNQLGADVGNYLIALAPPLLFAIALMLGARRVFSPSRRRAWLAGALAPTALVTAFFIPTQHRHVQAATPDTLYLHAVGGLIRTQFGFTEQSDQLRPRARESLPVDELTRAPEAPPRNIVLFILESVRADSACVVHDRNCRRTEYSNRLLPQRYPFTQMRAHASSTAISLAVLWAGVGPHESREVLHTWPLIFDYARAAGYDTAFWTSQNMMFGNARLWVKNLGVSKFVSATDLDPVADLDIGAPEHLLARHVNREIDELSEPFLAVIQLSNVHYPYLVDPSLPQPFQPATTSKDPDRNGSFKNHYQNAVHQQDLHVANMIEHIRGASWGDRTVIMLTSDHGEAFREHNQTGHTFSIFDEEIKVPAWIDAPPGTLMPEEAGHLKDKRDAYVFHVDFTPTILDLMGVWDDPAIARYKEKMLGTSLLRPELTTRPLPMSNCAGVWSCAFENWGYMQGHMKLEARSWDPGYRCFDLRTDPFERHNLGPARCGQLQKLALETFGGLPGKGKPRAE